MPKTPAITQFIETTRNRLAGIDQQMAQLTRERELETARLEAVEQVAGLEGHTIRDPRGTQDMGQRPSGAEASSRQRSLTIKAGEPLTVKRAPAGAWRGVFRKLLGREQFTYDDVVEIAASLEIEATKPSARVRVSKFKDSGYLDRISDGVYKVTEEGKKFFGGH